MQQGALCQVVRVVQQAMALGILRAAHRGDLFVHQFAGDQAGELIAGEIQRQIDVLRAEIDRVVAHPDIQGNRRVAGGKVGQPRHQPAFGERGADIDR
ncbi:hypothetical protein D9M68_731920 [compost metagenome]